MKWIAVLLMVLDHFGYYFEGFIPEVVVLFLRIVGRLAFPLFAYSVASGYQRTSNKKKYFCRMFLFALFTQLLLYLSNLVTGIPTGINVLFTFALSILCLVISESLEAIWRFSRSHTAGEKMILLFGKQRHVVLVFLLSVLGLAAIIFLTIRFAPDYHLFGLASVVFFYYARKVTMGHNAQTDRKLEPEYGANELLIMGVSYFLLNLIWMTVRISLLAVSPEWSMIQLFSAAAVFLIPLGRTRGKPKTWEKYFFYVFYPVHLVIFVFLRYAFLQIR